MVGGVQGSYAVVELLGMHLPRTKRPDKRTGYGQQCLSNPILKLIHCVVRRKRDQERRQSIISQSSVRALSCLYVQYRSKVSTDQHLTACIFPGGLDIFLLLRASCINIREGQGLVGFMSV